MQVSNVEWSTAEQAIAENAFKVAYERETESLIREVRNKTGEIEALDEVWQLHDFLSARRHEIDGKYDYQVSVLVFVFAGLVREGWLGLDELKGLETSKLTKIAALSRM